MKGILTLDLSMYRICMVQQWFLVLGSLGCGAHNVTARYNQSYAWVTLAEPCVASVVVCYGFTGRCG